MEKPDESGFSQLKGSFTREKTRGSFSHSQKESNKDVSSVEDDECTTTEDVDAQETRQKRFTSTLQGNRFEELRSLRDKEREDAIQKGLIDDPSKPRQLDEAVTFVGTCQDMCPEYEREQREYQNNLERWEINPETGRVDKNLAVKAFHRPAAGNEQALPSDVRPPPVLKKSLDYLIDKIVCGPYPLEATHFFVRDRTRSIRQDFTLQNNRGLEAVACHERIARYHILCLHQLCEKKNFSSQQEVEQLRKVLQSLCEFYDDLRKEGISCPNEAEFRSYSIITHLRDQDVVRQSQILPIDTFNDPRMQLSLRLSALAQKNNERIGHLLPLNTEATPNLYTRFFKLVKSSSVTYLMACLLESHFTSIRKGAIKAMRKAYMSVHAKFPCIDLQRILQFDTINNVLDFCEYYSLEVYEENGEQVVNLNKASFFDDSKPDSMQRFSHTLVESKLKNRSFAAIINGDNTSMEGEKLAKPKIPVSKPMPDVETRGVIAEKNSTPAFSKGKLNVNAPSFVPSFSISLPKTPLNAELPKFDEESLPSVVSEKSYTPVPLPSINKPTPSERKPTFSLNDLNTIFQSVVERTLGPLCVRICREVYDEFINETSGAIYISMVKDLIRLSSLESLTIEIYNSTVKARAFGRIKLIAQQCWLAKRKREIQRLKEQQQEEHYKAVLSSLLGNSCLNSRRAHGTRVFSGDYNVKNEKASEQIRQEHDRIQKFWEEEDINSFLNLLNKHNLRSPWHLLIFSASNNPSIYRWFRSKLGLKCSSNPSVWSLTHKIVDKEYNFLMPDTILDLSDQRMCYGACIYDMGLIEDSVCNSPSIGDGNDPNSKKDALTDPLRDNLFSFLKVVSDRTTTKFPLLLVMWTRGNCALEDYVERLRFMDIITSSWSAVSSIHVLTIINVEDATLGESLKLLSTNVTSELSPSFQVEQISQNNRKREAEIRLNSMRKKRPLRRTLPSFEEEIVDNQHDLSHILPDTNYNADSLTLLRDKIKKAQQILSKVQTTK
ncbi:nuclear export factor Sac3 [Schizosaccharomyces octosporus yFS286]|uniref:Nuclear mRNA export factor n=1 Tax=Schizosaccharomyces octosporus (strain yFS286) TaxID=483514 RepID=S9Q1P3_SCHOY|nr:nuclear export factor Sac3 [Schizosaccharomyces octosporus yFS286]EPX73608.1 nuclear export factor Sac3 [Schizosaccharomyces octosporus yFS286]